MADFETLPTEIIILILHHTADFMGVNSLLQGSLKVRLVFRANYLQIVEDLLKNCPSTSHENFKLCLTVGLIRDPSFKPLDLNEFISHSSVIVSEKGLPHISEESAFVMIEVAAQLQLIACACLSRLLQNFCEAHGLVLPHQWHRNGTGPFSWVEEFRVYHALWQLQAHADLQRAASFGSTKSGSSFGFHEPWGGWKWTQAEKNKIADLFQESHVQSYQTQGIAIILQEMGARSRYDEVAGPSLKEELDVGYKYQLPLIEFSEISHTIKSAAWSTPEIPKETEINMTWDRCINSSRSPRQALFYKTMQLNLAFRPGRYATGLDDMLPFYRIGIFIWDTWRMYSMGLLDMGKNKVLQAPDGASFEPTTSGLRVLQKRWCALAQKSPGGSESTRKRMETIPLF
jgi:hypothetical protein